jgi:hypothetical protein
LLVVSSVEWVFSLVIRFSVRTTMRLVRFIVERWCAMMMVVRSFMSDSRVVCMVCSFLVLSVEVVSSSNNLYTKLYQLQFTAT